MSGTGFFRSGDEKVFGVFSSQEAYVLVNLTEQILELLGEKELAFTTEEEPLSSEFSNSEFMNLNKFMNLVGISTNDAPPNDPVLLRLFPNAYDDISAASEFRRYTEHDLREKKREHANTIRTALLSVIDRNEHEKWREENSLDLSSLEIEIPIIQIMDWLAGLNDIRLALAVRLGIEKPPAEAQHKKYELMKESDPMKAVYAVYSWLGWLQESLIKLL